MTTVEDDVRTALDVARNLAAAGIPIFIAPPDPSNTIGFALPRGQYEWQNGRKIKVSPGWEGTIPDPRIVDFWQPGMALCAVMGCGLDLIDIDPRHGGDLAALGDDVPTVLGAASTPSGGAHYFVRSLGVRSQNGFLPGIDVKAGQYDGQGRGFAFLAPTVRPSKVTGEPATYHWTHNPRLDLLSVQDGSGAALAARVQAARGASVASSISMAGPDWYAQISAAPQSQVAAERAINAKITEVTNWTVGSGSNFRETFMRAALTLGGYVGGGYLDEQDAEGRLEQAAAAVWGSADADDRLWIYQGLSDGATRPFTVYTPEDERLHGPTAQARAAEGEILDAPDLPPEELWSVFSILPRMFDPNKDGTDQGLAKAVIDHMFPVLRYAQDAGLWVKRERDVWETYGDDLSDWAVVVSAEAMPPGEQPVPKEVAERTPEHWQAVRRAIFMSSAGAGKISRKIRAVMRSDHPATLRLTELDTNPEILWAGRVPWDLRTSGELPTVAGWVDPNTPHLHAAACAPDPTVPTPRWDAFTAAVLPDPEVRAWALRVLSVAITGYPDAVVPVLYGRERSGKTSLVEMLVQILGSYAHAANAKLLSAQDNSHDVIIYDLMGRRLSFVDEGPKRGHEATERLKQLTGGGSLTARAMRANPITFRPTHTLVMTTNNEPHLTDPALRARMRLIPCDSPEAAVRPLRVALLNDGLRREAPGILAALMRECAAWLADRDSASVAAAPLGIRGMAQEMAEGQDPVREWVQACTIPTDPGTPGRTLYAQHFARWHQDHPLYRRLTVPSETAFGRTLTEMGYPSHKTAGAWHRPLSVLGGPGSPGPTPQQFMINNVPGGSLAGPGGSAAGPGAEPAEPHNPRSGPLFASTVGGLAGIYPIQHTTEHTEIHTDIYGERPPEPATPAQEVLTGPLTCDDDAGGSGWREPASATGVPEEAPPPPDEDSSPPATTSPRSVTKGDAARKAAEDKITKAEARRKIAEENRLAAIDAAAGEHIGLPAVATREGHLLAVTLEQAEAIVRAAVVRAGALTVDVETSGFPVGHHHHKLRTVQLGDEVAAVVLDAADPAQRTAIRALLAEAPKLHAHSAAADLVPLAHADLIDAGSGWARMFDTVIPAKLGDPQSTGSDPGLKKLADAVLGASSVAPAADAGRETLFKAGRWPIGKKRYADQLTADPAAVGWAQVDYTRATMIRYAASDVLDTAALPARLPVIPDVILARERLAEEMTARVTHRGLPIDADRVNALTAEHTALRAEALTRITPFGIDNPGSTAQLAPVLQSLGAALPISPKGNPSTAEHVLSIIKRTAADTAAGQLATAVLDYRHSETVLNLFLATYRALIEHGDARVRPTIYTLGTDTGRMSGSRPNPQQLSREGGVRSIYRADPGHVLISADFSGVELRGAAALSQDPAMLYMIAEEDAGRFDGFHWEVARQAFGPNATKADRYVAKRGVFGTFYGGGAERLSEEVGVPVEEVEKIRGSLRAIAPGYFAWADQLRQGVRRGHTQFPAYSGRVIHFPADTPHKAPAYAVQGTCREPLIDALVRWRDTRWGDATLLPVHDELIVMVPEEDAQAATAELVACMEGELYGVRIVADPSEPSTYWTDSA